MTKVPRALIIDCYVDEPACLGVPPYISPQVRAAVGAARAAGAEAEYVTIDHGLFPSVLASKPAVKEALSKGDRFVMLR